VIRLAIVRARLALLTLLASGCSPFNGSDANVAADGGTPTSNGDAGSDAGNGGTAATAIHCTDHSMAVACDDFESEAPYFGATTVYQNAAISFSIEADPRGQGKVLSSVLNNKGGTPNGNLDFDLSPALLLGDNRKLRLSFAYQVVGNTSASFELLGGFALFYGATQSNGSQIFAIGTNKDAVFARDSNTYLSGNMDNGATFHRAQIDLQCTSATGKTMITWTAKVDGVPIDTGPQVFADTVSGVRVWIGQFYMANDATDTKVLFDDVLVEVP